MAIGKTYSHHFPNQKADHLERLRSQRAEYAARAELASMVGPALPAMVEIMNRAWHGHGDDLEQVSRGVFNEMPASEYFADIGGIEGQ